MIQPNIFLIIERDNAMDRYPHRLLIYAVLLEI